MQKLIIAARLLLVVLCLLYFTAGHAQTRARLKGSVHTAAGQPVSGATIALLHGADSSLVRYAVSDTAGKYMIEVPAPGDYLLSATSVGLQTRFSALVHVVEGSESIPMELLVMETDSRSLKGVTVAARPRPPIEIKADRLVLNVANNVNAVGSNALELLRKSPGVRVDDDDILINGKKGIAVYIDGRPTNMSGHDLTTILANIQSSNIESIEVINNPAAKLDAAGAGIINIRLKKNLSYGLNADVTATYAQAHWPKADGALNLNYRNKKMNVFASYGYLTARYRTWSDFFRQQVSKGILTTFDQRSISDQTNHTHNYKAGADFSLSSKSTLGLLFNGTSSHSPSFVSSTTQIYNNAMHIDSILIAPSDFRKRFDRASYNINYQYQDTSGRTLNVDLDYDTFNNQRNSFQPNTYYNTAGAVINQLLFKIATVTDATVRSAKADYEQKFMGGQLGLGFKMSQVKTSNDFRYYDTGMGYDTLNPARSNLFFYDERIDAAYLSYLVASGKWTVQAGLRSEHTRADGDLITSTGHNQAVDTSYLNFFPSGSVTYHLNEKKVFGISYSRRIERPAYIELNPFETPLDVLTVSKGNAFLRPQYTNNLVLSFVYGSFSSSFGYSRTSDYSSQVLDTLSNGRSIQTYKNIRRQQVVSLNLVEQLAIRKWWYSFISVNAYRTAIEGALNGGYLNLSANSLNVYADESFSLPKNWRIQLSGFYNAPSVNGTVRNRSYWSTDIGFQKRFLDNRTSLRLSFTDVFKTLKNRGIIDFEGLYINGHIRWESRQAKLTFSYRFGNNVKEARKRNTSSEDEKRRIRD